MSQIEIMSSDPAVVRDGRRVEIKGRPGKLFRLLVLQHGHTVSNHMIAQLHETKVDSARSHIRYLRDQLDGIGCKQLIQNGSNGYRASLDDWYVDAHDFYNTVKPLKSRFDPQFAASLDLEVAREYVEKLTRVIGLWRENPAIALPYETGFEATFGELKSKAEKLLIMAQWRIGEMHEAIRRLQQRTRAEPDDATWEFLLLALDAAGIKPITDWDRLVNQHNLNVPEKLSSLMAQLGAGKAQNPLRIAATVPSGAPPEPQPERSVDDAASLLSLCTVLGITTASQLRLTDSQLTPEACIQRAKTRLYFSGVLASKWVIDPGVRSAFARLLSRLDANKGEARFLVINPEGDAFRRLNELREGQISTDSIAPLKHLAEQHRSLQVRLFDSLPAFRIVVIDDDVVSFSPYRLAADAYLASGRGWEAPHVVLDPMANYPLAEAFLLLFKETWENAVPIGEVL